MIKKHATRVAGHVLALAVGMALAMQVSSRPPQSSASSDVGESSRVHGVKTAAETSRVRRKSESSKSSSSAAETYRQAWKLLQEQPRAERERMRQSLLSAWAKVDLRGAIEAAMLEPDSRRLLDAFNDRFDENPDAIKSCFEGESFGLKTAIIRGWWIEKMGVKDPVGLFERLAEFGAIDQGQIVATCLAAGRADATRQAAIIAYLSGLDDHAGHRKLWAAAARELVAHGSPQAVLDQLCQIPGAAGRVMVGQAMAILLEKTDYAGARASYASLRPELRREIAEAALVKPGRNVGAYLAAMDEVINTSDWQKLSGRLGMNLHDLSVTTADHATLLAWAAKLPERDDMLDLYRVAVRGFVTHQPEKARAWIATVPAGWKRENSLAAYAQSALGLRQNAEDAQWALQQIVDPKFREMANDWIDSYEKKTGRKYPR